jgi:hypothetical protein
VNGEDVGLSTGGSWVRIPEKARRGICEQDTPNTPRELYGQLRWGVAQGLSHGLS